MESDEGEERGPMETASDSVEWLAVGEAVIPRAKIVEYLLSLTHSDGQSKARFFLRFGFTPNQWEELAQALRDHATQHPITKMEPSPFGIRYVIEGTMQAPDGRAPAIRTVWFIREDETAPRFVTAYPHGEKVP